MDIGLATTQQARGDPVRTCRANCKHPGERGALFQLCTWDTRAQQTACEVLSRLERDGDTWSPGQDQPRHVGEPGPPASGTELRPLSPPSAHLSTGTAAPLAVSQVQTALPLPVRVSHWPLLPTRPLPRPSPPQPSQGSPCWFSLFASGGLGLPTPGHTWKDFSEHIHTYTHGQKSSWLSQIKYRGL